MIQQLWRDNPRANIGVPTGPQFWVLDIDGRHGGHESLAALEGEFGELPNTLLAKTPSGGYHFYFAPRADARNSTSKVGDGIDVRGHGGYVCVEGSLVAGAGYSFQDWDPLMDGPPELAEAPAWLIDRAFGKPAPQSKSTAPVTDKAISEGGRNSFLASQAGKMRRQGFSASVIEAALIKVNAERCTPPLPLQEIQQIAHSVGRYEPAAATESIPKRNVIRWAELAKQQPPEFAWLLEHWLSWHVTLLSGRGGIGKSLLAQQIATGLAIGRPLWSTACAPVKVLYWACEDDTNEIWRRQDRICRDLGIGFDALDRLYIDARCGLDNAIFSTEFSKPAWTPLYAELEAEINDYGIDVLILDNLSQTYGGNENDRHHVTTFLNGILGLVRDRPFCPIILGHIAKSPTSEYSGSTAWENAARMRWYLGDKLPDQEGADPTSDGTVASETRFLCKRKTNYSAQDYIEFQFDAGVFKVKAQADDTGSFAGMRARRARSVVLYAIGKLAEKGLHGGEKRGPGYLPSLISEMGLTDGINKGELSRAMNDLIMDGEIVKSVVGKNTNRTPKYGLVLAAHN